MYVFYSFNISRTIQIKELDNYKYNLNHLPTSKCKHDTKRVNQYLLSNLKTVKPLFFALHFVSFDRFSTKRK